MPDRAMKPTAPDPADPHAAHGAMAGHGLMEGMATPEQMAELAASSGTDFDRLFLALMIAHHEGAITMVEHLLSQSGSAFDPVLFDFTTDVTNEQEAEIRRMSALANSLTIRAPICPPVFVMRAKPSAI